VYKKPRYVIVHGDTLSTLSGAVAASQLYWPKQSYTLVHIESGLRSGSLREPFPEEVVRRIVDCLSEVRLSATKRYHHRNSVYVGNTIVDTVNYVMKKKPITTILPNPYGLVTVHRHENITNKRRLIKIITILKIIKMPLIMPLSSNTRKQLRRFRLMKQLERYGNVQVIDPLLYTEFLHLMNGSRCVITDGGSVQEESLVLRKPCLLLRKRTERQEGLQTKAQFLTGLNISRTRKIVNRLQDKEWKVPVYKNPYGEPGVSKKIVEYLLS
jgi:UDP-N-acetylglucosamine 2-epimerase